MAPGGEILRYHQHFGENVLHHGSHEWLPYSKNVVRTKSSNINLSLIFLFYHTFRHRARDWGKGKIAVDFRGGIEYDKHKEMGPCPYI